MPTIHAANLILLDIVSTFRENCHIPNINKLHCINNNRFFHQALLYCLINAQKFSQYKLHLCVELLFYSRGKEKKQDSVVGIIGVHYNVATMYMHYDLVEHNTWAHVACIFMIYG